MLFYAGIKFKTDLFYNYYYLNRIKLKNSEII
jgi:hypothetical protein